MKKILFLLAASVALAAVPVMAQSTNLTVGGVSIATIQTLLSQDIITIGQPFTVKGQSFLITTNANGTLDISSTGAAGSLNFTPPSTDAGVASQAQAWVGENNPTNIGFYSTNEIDLRVGAAYQQSSGQAVVDIALEKYGLIKPLPGIGVFGGVLEGNGNSSSGLAAAYAGVDYRKPIGDVAIAGKIEGGWDNWTRNGFVAAGARIEYRQNAHLGEFVNADVAWEPRRADYPIIIGGGISYAF